MEQEPIICDGVNLRCKVCGESLVGKVRYSDGRESWCICHGRDAEAVQS